MAKTKEQKQEVVHKIETALKGTSSVFVHFTGISVAQETAMRRAMRGEGLGYLVAKKTLMRRALESLGLQSDLPMQGEVAVAYSATSSDATAPARRVYGFGKEFGADKLTIVGGVFEGRVVDAATMQEIATIPSMQVLRGMFVNVINSPIQRLAIALGQVAQKKA